jgi:uncharacterized protein
VFVNIDVRGLLGQPGRQRETDLVVPVSSIESPEGTIKFEPARVNLVLTSAPDGIVATATVDAKADVYCSRCLASYTERIHGEVDHMFVTAPTSAHEGPPRGSHSRGKIAVESIAGDDDGPAADEPDTSPVVDGQIDIAPLVMEALSLGLPMKPLCRPDCKGLCPTCGCNLNETKCLCAVEGIDPRLAGLGSLMAQAPEAPAVEPAGKSKEKDQRGRSKT